MMSKQLALSSAFSVLTMSAFVLFGDLAVTALPPSPAPLLSVQTQAPELPLLGALQPGLR